MKENIFRINSNNTAKLLNYTKNILDNFESYKKKLNNIPILNISDKSIETDFGYLYRNLHLNTNIDNLIKLVTNKQLNDKFELQHPYYPDVKTQAIESYHDGKRTNCVLMVDEECEYPWIFIQNCTLMNFLVMEDGIYHIGPNWMGIDYQSIYTFLWSISQKDIFYFNRPFYFLITNHRPFHFFREQYHTFHILENTSRVYFKNSFFKSKLKISAENIDEDGSVFISLYTAIRGLEYKFNNKNKFHEEIVQECLLDKENFIQKDKDVGYDLILWLGLPGEKRKILDNYQGFAEIIKVLSLYFNKMKIFIDGMTSFDGEKKDIFENRYLYENFKDKLKLLNIYDGFIYDFVDTKIIGQENKFLVLHSLAGYDYRSKICFCSDSDIVITETSTTSLVPITFCKKPGVIFSPSDDFFLYAKQTAKYPNQLIADTRYLFSNTISYGVIEYYIPWQYILNLIGDVLKKTKNIQIASLDIPDITLYKDIYTIKKQIGIALSYQDIFLYNSLNRKLDDIISGKDIAGSSLKQKTSLDKNILHIGFVISLYVNLKISKLMFLLLLNLDKKELQQYFTYNNNFIKNITKKRKTFYFLNLKFNEDCKTFGKLLGSIKFLFRIQNIKNRQCFQERFCND
ncbi:hypothetical protein KJQ67_07075 [Campylobacter lari]|uniref:hypothetical protein n=1 Tax=Campylobacter lari TaxID=201 RepID=UPI001BDA0080|nr:hypothetical protein [Campylobacter lari]MBT0820983.1 hypothetical protein [Campylobacter lari]MCV3458945.1 hypothetical protein [Campylobacter lari]